MILSYRFSKCFLVLLIISATAGTGYALSGVNPITSEPGEPGEWPLEWSRILITKFFVEVPRI